LVQTEPGAVQTESRVLQTERAAPPTGRRTVPTGRRVELRLENGMLVSAGIQAPPEVQRWVQQASQAITAYYGRFPVERARMMLEGVDGSGVRWARTFAHAGASVRVGLGRHTNASQFTADWMLTHEFVHLALPQLADEHDWLQEGAATYVEPIARAQAGQLAPERVWSEFMRDMPQGLPRRGDRGLDFTTTWGRTYWGGALFCLVADVEIRKRTDNRFGLQDALRAILREGGSLEQRWTIGEALRTGDRATGQKVLMQMYGEWRAAPVNVDLEALWRELGVERQGASAVLNDEASLAYIRRSITGGAIAHQVAEVFLP
jgi:hypothetical protein